MRHSPILEVSEHKKPKYLSKKKQLEREFSFKKAEEGPHENGTTKSDDDTYEDSYSSDDFEQDEQQSSKKTKSVKK